MVDDGLVFNVPTGERKKGGKRKKGAGGKEKVVSSIVIFIYMHIFF